MSEYRVQVDVKTEGQAKVLADYIEYFIKTSSHRGVDLPQVLVVPLEDQE